MTMEKYWITSHGLLNGKAPSAKSTDHSDHWIQGHNLYHKSDSFSTARDLLDNHYLDLIDYVKDSDGGKSGNRLNRATGGNVDTVSTTPTWAAGAPANSATMASGGRVRSDNFPAGNKRFDDDITCEWNGNDPSFSR